MKATGMSEIATWRIPGGYQLRDLIFQVPVDHFGRVSSILAPLLTRAPTMSIFAREVVANTLSSSVFEKKKPYLVYLQGGPGFPSPSPTAAGLPGWVTRAAMSYTVLLLDQRGTGKSSPITHQTIGHLDPQQQAEYLSMFRSDSIVEDLEIIRHHVHNSPSAGGELSSWSLLGQSFGGFVITNYVHLHPKALREIFYTGGLPITNVPAAVTSNAATVGATSPLEKGQLADACYRATWKQAIARNQRYYKKYPSDVCKVKELLLHLHHHKAVLPSGGHLTPRRFLLLGIKFGFEGGYDTLHQLVNSAFVTPALSVVTTEAKKVLCDNFLRDVDEAGGHFDTNPIYAILHESIYCDGPGQQSLWAAERMMKAEFATEFHLEKFLAISSAEGYDQQDHQPVFFFGEMVFSWMFDDFAQLRCMKASSQLLAEKSDWPKLYDRSVALSTLSAADAPRAAAVVYYDDMYVDRACSLQTATEQLLPVDVRLWVTNEYDHGGLRVGGSAILERLIGLANGTIDPR